jgi:hypothetical protein
MSALVDATDLIRALYHIFLGREPDPVGFSTYSNQIYNNRSVEEVIADFLKSSEFKARAPEFLRDWKLTDQHEYHGIAELRVDDENLYLSPAATFSALQASLGAEARDAVELFSNDPGDDVGRLLDAYISGAGATNHSARATIRTSIEKLIKKIDGRNPHVFYHDFHVLREIVEQYAPATLEKLFAVLEDTTEVSQHEILSPTRNELRDAAWPYPFKQGFDVEIRPGLKMLSVAQADVHVHPSCYAIFDRSGMRSWASGNLLGLGKPVLRSPMIKISGDIVVVRDFFSGSNFAHFLFDAVTRLGHFCEWSFDQASEALFIFGGLPLPFQKTVLGAVERQFGLRPEQFFFPSRGLNVRTEQKIYWFSDQKSIAHPARYFDAPSVDLLKNIAKHIEVFASPYKRLYVSRSDAGHRMICNEDEVIHHLSKLGFVAFRLGELPIEQQFSLMVNAEIIIAPHGMGLTYLALREKSVSLLELFHPTVATPAYALLAKAYGFPYRAVMGREVDVSTRSYSVDVAPVIAALQDFLN